MPASNQGFGEYAQVSRKLRRRKSFACESVQSALTLSEPHFRVAVPLELTAQARYEQRFRSLAQAQQNNLFTTIQ
jgi:hypothetical protein